MLPPPPLDVVDLIAEERAALLALLDDLRPDEWRLPTACPGWSVHDLAVHMLGDDLGVLSRGADAYAALAPAPANRSSGSSGWGAPGAGPGPPRRQRSTTQYGATSTVTASPRWSDA